MSLGDVFAFFGALLSIGLALPALLLAWQLLLPERVAVAARRLEEHPRRCAAVGALLLLISLPLVVGLIGGQAGPLQLVGWLALAGLCTLASIGASGLAALMGRRWQASAPAPTTTGATLRGALVLELALATPIIGWFILLPLVTVMAVGAAGPGWWRHDRRPRPMVTGESHVAQSA